MDWDALMEAIWPTAAAAAYPGLYDQVQDDDKDSDPSTLPFSSSSTSTTPLLSQPPTPPDASDDSTMQTTSPINIATPTRNSSSSPPAIGKKIVTYHGDEDSRTSAMMSAYGHDSNGRARQDSFGGAKPISMNNPNRNAERPRRESLAGSLVAGMSWGGVSVGSWVRDDIIMAGTSPFAYQSPSYHSSSYLPKLEANFMRDFSCCGKTLPTLHDLLQHYEESHAQQTPQSLRNASAAQQSRDAQPPNSKAAYATQAATSVQQQAQAQQQRQQQQPQTDRPRSSGVKMGQPATGTTSSLAGGIQLMRQQLQAQPTTPTQRTVQPVEPEMDEVEDMEMDDADDPLDQLPETTALPPQRSVQPVQPSLFGQQPRPVLNMSGTGLIHQGLRTSQPTTPATSAFAFQNNPTVSSVNTPTLSTQSVQQQGQGFSPDSSIPGTPVEPDDEYGSMAPNMNYGNMNMNTGNANFGYGYGGDLGVDLCIDDPAKRLYSPGNGFNNQRALQQQFASFGLSNGHFGNNDDLMRRFRQQQIVMMQSQGVGNGSAAAAMMMNGEEHKPFRCPVIGCEKAYKNQNGLKYHKTHGHQTQQLHENGDGTFSIVNPETSTPYPGTLGMEKEKPYKCEVCGKRYKNLNGLKYHKQHSPPCNPDLKPNGQMPVAGLGGALGGNAIGLPGIGEEGLI